MKVHHYMVDFLADSGAVEFANETELFDLVAAKRLAVKTSLKAKSGSAYAVAFADNGDGTYKSVGHVGYYNGVESDLDGVVA